MKEIPLTRGFVAFVDDEDYKRLSGYKWHATSRGGYACRQDNKNGNMVLMHREIMGLGNLNKNFVFVDHINGCNYDNRGLNLRLSTYQENLRNSCNRVSSVSKFKGVHWSKDHKKWLARICVDGKSVYLGAFRDEAGAARAYDFNAKKTFGKFAYLNFPDNPIMVDIPVPSESSVKMSLSRGLIKARQKIEQPRDKRFRFIPLTNEKVAIVDADDLPLVSGRRWWAHRSKSGKWYVISRHFSMARLILGLKHGDGKIADHIDGDPLNNTKVNLRIVSPAQNAYNRSPGRSKYGFKGISWHPKINKWEAHINKNNKRFNLGVFSSKIGAAKAYDRKAVELFGEFARTNFPRLGEDSANVR